MPFGNPIVAGEELIRSAIRSENYSDGSDGNPGAGWRITRNGDADFNNVNVRGDAEGGSASFDSVSANTSLLYRGNELSSLLEQNARGVVCFGQYAAASVPATTTERAFLQIDVFLYASRVYEISTTPYFISNSHGGSVIRYEVPATSGGTAPNPTLASAFYTYTGGTTAGPNVSTEINILFYPPRDGIYKFLWTSISFNGTSNVLNNGGGAAPNPSIWVKDVGRFVLNTGVSNPLNTPIPSKQFREFDVQFTDFRSYDSSGAYWTNQYSYQGKVPGVNSNRTGWSWFPLGSVGTPSIADLSGVPAGDLVYMDLYAFFPHWYNSSGGTAVYGYHGTTAVPSIGATEPGGGIVAQLNVNYPGRNIGQWASLFGTTIGAAILAGTFRGVITGNHAGSNSFQFYGYASDMRIRAGYYK